MVETSPFAARQFHLMSELIQLYENGKLSLYLLITKLEALLDCLEETNPTWVTLFREQWEALEQVYAIALDRGQSLEEDNFIRQIASALQEMKTLLKSIEANTM
jgi:hypothetical protein